MKVQISKSRGIDYEDRYEIEIRTSRSMSDKEFKSISDAIEVIAEIMNPKINTAETLKQVKK